MKILFATDGSAYSEKAASFLTRFSWSPNDSIVVFHALYWIPFQYDKEFYCDTFKELKKKVAPRIFDSILDILKPVQANISVEIAEGSPEYCIVDMAAKADIDLIVIGARGITGVEAAFIGLGSVSRSVAIDSSKPVLVIKPQPHRTFDRMKVLFATDGSDSSRVAGEFLSSLPFPDETELTIIHVARPKFLDVPEQYVMEMNEQIKEIESSIRAKEFTKSEKIIKQAGEYLKGTFKNIEIRSKAGDPSTEILKTGDALGADIIAIGCRGLRGIKGMMGSVSRNILAHSTCSVLIGKTCKE